MGKKPRSAEPTQMDGDIKKKEGGAAFKEELRGDEAKGSARSTECEHERGAQCTEHSDGSPELKV